MMPTQMTNFRSDELARYARHLQLDEIGAGGQARLRAARVLIVGLGGLGCPAALYLAAAGVGTIGLVDGDRVAISNLQRQVIYTEGDIGELKVEAAARQLRAMNSHINVQLHPVRLTAENAAAIFADYDFIFDGTDNFAAHYLVNDAAVLGDKKLVWGSVEKFAGQVGVVSPRISACYRCVYPSPPPEGVAPSCADIGVLGAMPGLIATMQTVELLKLILGLGEGAGRIMCVDAMMMQFKTLHTGRDENCVICGNIPTLTELQDRDAVCVAGEITRDELLRAQDIFLLDVRNADEFAAGALPNAVLIPLPDLAARVHELNPAWDIVVYCKSGKRSAQAAETLRRRGFKNIRTLRGGIMAA